MSQTIDDLIHFIQITENSKQTVHNNNYRDTYTCEDILEFWFGDDTDDWTKNIRNKWFVASNSNEQLQLDDYIKRKYNALLEALLQNTNNVLNKWKNDSLRSCLAAIIVLDQFSRHIHRKEMNECRKGERENVDKCDDIALELSKYIISNEANNNVLSTTLTVPQYIFCLMPYRHSKQSNNIEFVLKEIDQRLNKNISSFNELMLRFKRGTMKQIQGMPMESVNNDDILQHDEFDYKTKTKLCTKQKQKRKWKKRQNNEDNDIITNNKLYMRMKSYLSERNIAGLQYVFVSLSGGVDSMVIASILYYIKLFEKHIFDIVSIHIDYGNRLESHKEALFLEQWCNHKSILFRKRTICSIKRGVTKRDDYERISRDIRFKTYKAVLNEFKCSNDGNYGIIFGHHRGDIEENVISNMMKGCSLLNISGMESESVINDVSIWRPLLNHEKQDIFAFAHTFGVAYFKDTTPKWSSRGRMRNELLPLLKDIFGDGFAHNLSTLSVESTQFKEMAQRNIFSDFWNKMCCSECAVWIDCAGFENECLLFWKETLKHLCQNMLGIARIHEKGIKRELMNKLRVKSKSSVDGWWLQLRREYKCYLMNNKQKTLFIFVPQFAPILSGKVIKYNYYVQHGTELRLIFNKEYRFGVWSIQFVKENHLLHLHNKDHRITLRDIANGYFYYFLPLLDQNGHYLIDKTKTVRKKLKCFRGLPHGMKQILPMLIAKGNMKVDAQICVRVCISFHRNACSNTLN